METKKKLKVSAIRNGTVIDRIPAGELFHVIEILGLAKGGLQMTFGTNLESKVLGTKSIIKITDKFFEEDDVNRIALVAPDAVLNIIKEYKVVEKRRVVIPSEICGLVRCLNPRCITNHEPVRTRFITSMTPEGLVLRCHYCEKETEQKNLQIISNN
ncbi:MAG: aspartate carbamoyltransferase regulatory subunit [Bacteroidales bacterium]|jgi:aspartate carbamoyltransferase regulatory subunit|nr:aspartate carbamoyltransferase regulatory subunit [Bacteroidales bacterium]MDD2263915.1 aspartate carbamoyltransferase regulatory subunit [Bacteroidales bacterium]MDD2831149.1 aspartate carbamoyltransferase regulatory subunit [Bacteroidales bacterium]MDD3209260.1 aspartate carbamoyltransferase regulatory subunit [Bacteroidales bacterium]MDD3697613.1 aspartate carbamoyltransferase regulatory subunit [Bacteroidales bacterium]